MQKGEMQMNMMGKRDFRVNRGADTNRERKL